MAHSSTRDPDSFYVEDCRQVQSNTFSIQTTTGQISRLISTMKSDQEFQQCRGMVDGAVHTATETRMLLRRIQEHQRQAHNAQERNNRRMMYHKLSDQLAVTARVFEDVVRKYKTAERQRIEASNPIADSGDLAGGDVQISFSKMEGSCTFASDLQQDKRQALQQVDEDVRCLQRIYTELTSAAEEQQMSFDNFDHTILSSSLDIEKGEEITRTRWDQQLRQRMCVVPIGILGFTAFAWFYIL